MIKEKRYKDFSNNLNYIGVQKRIPVRATFELTYRCNFNCIHCYIPPQERRGRCREELTTEEVFYIVDQLKNLGCFTICFTGGEIFTRKDILEILRHTKRQGFNILVFSNASLIDRNTVDELEKLRLNKIDITLHSLNKVVFEKITQVKDSYKKVMDAIRLLQEKNIPLGLKSVCMKENKNDIHEVSKFAKEIHAFYRIDAHVIPRKNGIKNPCGLGINEKDVEPIMKSCFPEMYEEYDEKGKPRKKVTIKRQKRENVFNCSVGYNSITVNPFGELNICLTIDYPLYNILKGTLKEGWQIIKDIIDNAKADDSFKCNSCELLQYCSWCPAHAWLEDGSFTGCSPICRKKAEERKAMFQKEEINA